MATEELHERVFTKAQREDFNKDTPKRPYLTFKLGPGELQRLVIKVWSHDQGWCDDHLKTEDPYANSHTWFSLGLIEESTPTQESPSELHEFRMAYEFMSEKGFSDGSVAYGLQYAMRTLRDQWVSKVESSGLKQTRDAVLITDTVQGTPKWVPYVHYGG